jgi:hypothetical protein
MKRVFRTTNAGRVVLPVALLALLPLVSALDGCGSSSAVPSPADASTPTEGGAPDVSSSDAAPDARLVDGALPDSNPVPPPDDATSPTCEGGVVITGFDASGVACGAATVGPTPADAGDTTYVYDPTSAAPCFSQPLCQISCPAAQTFIDGLLACAPAQGGYAWSFGSSYVRVHGIQSGSCVYDIGLEVEMGFKYLRCKAPLPVHAWPGLFFYDPSNGVCSPRDLAQGLEGCVLLANCGGGDCRDADGGVIDGGLPPTVPLCPTSGNPPQGC